MMENNQGPTEVVFTNGSEPGVKCESCHDLAHLNANCGNINLPCCGRDTCKRQVAAEARSQHVADLTRSYFAKLCF